MALSLPHTHTCQGICMVNPAGQGLSAGSVLMVRDSLPWAREETPGPLLLLPAMVAGHVLSVDTVSFR